MAWGRLLVGQSRLAVVRKVDYQSSISNAWAEMIDIISATREEERVTARIVTGSPARPQLMRAMNEQFMLEHIRDAGQISRADLSRTSGLSKNTVSLALSNLERAGLV